MSDIVEKLRLENIHMQHAIGIIHRNYRADLEKLRVENIQMKFALGYPMPADLERYVLPSNPFKCGTCDALRAEVERLRAALKKIAKVTYGSDWTWGSEELADYYSMRFFNAQETARAALNAWPGMKACEEDDIGPACLILPLAQKQEDGDA